MKGFRLESLISWEIKKTGLSRISGSDVTHEYFDNPEDEEKEEILNITELDYRIADAMIERFK